MTYQGRSKKLRLPAIAEDGDFGGYLVGSFLPENSLDRYFIATVV